jgi:hypothetical protein
MVDHHIHRRSIVIVKSLTWVPQGLTTGSLDTTVFPWHGDCRGTAMLGDDPVSSRRMMKRFVTTAFFVAIIAGCAAPLVTMPAALRPADAGTPAVQLTAPATGQSSAMFSRTLPAGTWLDPLGIIEQGIVYRPRQLTLTAEGMHISEAQVVRGMVGGSDSIFRSSGLFRLWRIQSPLRRRGDP